jgi:hypothetical protein
MKPTTSPNLKKASDTRWISSDDDPWFLVAGRFRAGRYTLAFLGRAPEGTPPTSMKLYYADEVGQFSERDMIALRPLIAGPAAVQHALVFELPRATTQLRFDPAELAGEFELIGLSIKRQSNVGRAMRIGGALVAAFARSPRRFVESVGKYVEAYAPETNAGASPPLPPPLPVGVSLPDVVPMNLLALAGREPRLNVILPGLVMRGMSGGPNTAINLTYRLARSGVPVRYISSDVEMERDTNLLWSHFSKVSGINERLPNVELVSAHDRNVATEIGDGDVFFGTAWWTVQMIKHALPQMRTRRFIYMIQDYEPGLYAWSTRYALAMETYAMDFFGIINARTLADYLFAQKVGRFADPRFVNDCIAFDPALDRHLFYPELPHPADQKKRLLFYARPQAPRNMYELGMVALRQAVARGAFPADQWELLFIGENLPPVHLGNGVVIRQAPWSSYDGYAALLRSSTVGLSLMLSPHPSYPPLEMGMCGMLPVTTTFSVKTAEVLEGYCRNIVAVPPRVEAVVDGLMQAFARSGDIDARRQNSVSTLPSTWDEVFEPMLPRIAEFWRVCAARQS